MPAKAERLLSIIELAEMLGLAPGTIYAGKCDTRSIPRIKIGSRVRFQLKAVEAWLAAKQLESDRKMIESKIESKIEKRKAVVDFNGYLRRKSK